MKYPEQRKYGSLYPRPNLKTIISQLVRFIIRKTETSYVINIIFCPRLKVNF